MPHVSHQMRRIATYVIFNKTGKSMEQFTDEDWHAFDADTRKAEPFDSDRYPNDNLRISRYTPRAKIIDFFQECAAKSSN